jgi:pimeloyl-ACP methyl ester carboxylesterase
VILLHGFPDSCHLFARHLHSYRFEGTKIVALDLPGYGGSDSLPSYGPDQVLNAVVNAIVELKHRYLDLDADEAARCILVGHDWGGVVGYRLAAESKGLIDEFVAVNSIYVSSLNRWKFGSADMQLAAFCSASAQGTCLSSRAIACEKRHCSGKFLIIPH